MNNTPLRTIRLYGALGTKFGRVHHLAVSSVAEAFRALGVLIPGFTRYIMESHKFRLKYALFVGKKNIGAEELTHPVGADDIRIAPVITGSKRGGLAQIIIGAVIIIGVTILSQGTLTGPALAATAGGGGLAGAAFAVGVSLVLGGVTQMLAPTQKGLSTQDGPDNGASYNFNGPVNTTAQGNPVPILYGEMIIGSATISSSIVAEDQQ